MNIGVKTSCNLTIRGARIVGRDRAETAHAPLASGGRNSGRVRPNVRWDHIKGAKTAILSVNIAFTATLQGHLGTPCVAGMCAPSVRFRRTRPSHD